MIVRPLITTAVASSCSGLHRTPQDRHVVDAALGVVLLAEGKGPSTVDARGAELAIRVAFAELGPALRQGLESEDAAACAVADAFGLANAAVQRVARRDGAIPGLVAALVGAVFCGEYVVFGSFGKMGMYRMRDATLTRVSTDRVLDIDELTQWGTNVAGNRQPLPRRAEGPRPSRGEPDMFVEALARGDVFVFCSYAFGCALEQCDIAGILLGSASLETACKRLAALGRDASIDVTVILVKIESIGRNSVLEFLPAPTE